MPLTNRRSMRRVVGEACRFHAPDQHRFVQLELEKHDTEFASERLLVQARFDI
jgi:hypothetical protein